jgi:hypothetical protein
MTREPTERPRPQRRALLVDAIASGAPQAIGSVATQSVAEPPVPAGTLRVAVVHSWDGVRFAAAALSRVDLVRRLSDYVRRRSPHTLWASDARHVRTLLARGELEAAVEVYFGRVGSRWDPEWLVTTAVATAGVLADAG